MKAPGQICVRQVNHLNNDYKIVPVYKGNYEQSLAAGIAAFRSGKAPAILQVYEVGTATMMASKAIKPVFQVFKDAIITAGNWLTMPGAEVFNLNPPLPATGITTT